MAKEGAAKINFEPESGFVADKKFPQLVIASESVRCFCHAQPWKGKLYGNYRENSQIFN